MADITKEFTIDVPDELWIDKHDDSNTATYTYTGPDKVWLGSNNEQDINYTSFDEPDAEEIADLGEKGITVIEIDCDAFEILLRINSDQFYRKRFGIILFGSDRSSGLQVFFSRESGCVHLGKKIIPFNYDLIATKPDFDLRVFVDKYLIEVLEKCNFYAIYVNFTNAFKL